MPVVSRTSLTAQALDAKFARRQQCYTKQYSVSYVHQPAPPPLLLQPERQEPSSPFPAWRAAAAELDLGGDDAGKLPASGAGVAMGASVPVALPSGQTAAGRHTLRRVLLGTSAVALLGVLGVLGGSGYAVRAGAVPGDAALKGSGVAALVRTFADSATRLVRRAVPDPAPSLPPGKDAMEDIPAPRQAPPVAAAPDRLALAGASADTPALAIPPLSASSSSAVTADAVPVPGWAAAEPGPEAKPSEPEAAAPAPTTPTAPAEAVPLPALAPTPEQATAATVAPAKAAVPAVASPAPAVPGWLASTAGQAAAKAVPPVKLPEPDTGPGVPPVAFATVRLPPAPEWTTAPPADLVSLPEAAALPLAAPALLAVPAAIPSLPAGPGAVPGEAAKAVPLGVEAQQVVSTMTLVRQMSLLVHDMHDEGLRYRTEVAALTGAVQAKASGLEERLKLAEARSGVGSVAEAGGPQGGLPGSGVAGDGGVPRAGASLAQVLRGYRVQAGSPGAAVLSDVGAGGERAARLLVMVGDQLPGAGRVTAIVPRGGSWIVRTERGIIQ